LKAMAGFRERLNYARSLLVTYRCFLATGVMRSVSLASSLFDLPEESTCLRAALGADILTICRIQLKVFGHPELHRDFRTSSSPITKSRRYSHSSCRPPDSISVCGKEGLFQFLSGMASLALRARAGGSTNHTPPSNPFVAREALRSEPHVSGGCSKPGWKHKRARRGFVLAEQSHADVVPVTIQVRALLVPRTYM
jgi:hypothetical protein